jgi:hypothetical protein
MLVTLNKNAKKTAVKNYPKGGPEGDDSRQASKMEQ